MIIYDNAHHTIMACNTATIAMYIPTLDPFWFLGTLEPKGYVLSHCVRIASLAPAQAPGPCSRYWYGVQGPKYTSLAKTGSDMNRLPEKKSVVSFLSFFSKASQIIYKLHFNIWDHLILNLFHFCNRSARTHYVTIILKPNLIQECHRQNLCCELLRRTVVTVRNVVAAGLCFHRRLWFGSQGGAYMAGGCAWWGACVVAGGVHSRGMCTAGGHAWQRDVCMMGGVCMAEGACMADGGMYGKGGVHGMGGMCGRRDGHCSGQYASYWNAFLWLLMIMATTLLWPVINFNGDYQQGLLAKCLGKPISENLGI